MLHDYMDYGFDIVREVIFIALVTTAHNRLFPVLLHCKEQHGKVAMALQHVD